MSRILLFDRIIIIIYSTSLSEVKHITQREQIARREEILIFHKKRYFIYLSKKDSDDRMSERIGLSALR